MKQLISLAVLCFSISIGLQAQSLLVVPDQMEFGDMVLKIDDSAKETIQKYFQPITKNNKFFRQLVERTDGYMPIVERILAEEGLPEDFKYLVIQESSLVSDVVSTSNAVGFWQFKRETGMDFGLRVDEEVDERMNIVASTRAAAKYLKKQNFYLNNWVFSLLSYYAGLSGAKSIIDQSKIGAKELVIDANTHWYVLKFLAHKLAFEPNLNRNAQLPLRVMEYPECENKTLEDIAAETNYPLEQIQFYNKWCLKGQVPTDKDYTVLVPVKLEDMAGFAMVANAPTQPNVEALKPWREKTFFGLFEKPATEVNTDVVMSSNEPIFLAWNGIKAIQAKAGDNIAKLCLQADLDKDDFLTFNDMRAFDAVQAGMVYYVKGKKNRAKIPYHTAKPGETLWEVSQNYGIKMSALMKKNRMKKPEKLKPGRVLHLRTTMPEDEPIKYESVPGFEENNNTFIVKSAPVLRSSQSRKKEDSTLQAINQKLIASLKNDTAIAQIDEEEEAEVPTISINLEKKSEPESVSAAAPEAPAQKTMPANHKVPASPNVCVVEPGMTLYAIAKKCGVSVDSLLAWNNMMTGDLRLGQTLKMARDPKPGYLPTGNNQTSSAKPLNWYEVKTGDTMFRIAKEHGISITELLKWNDKTEATLSVGERLKVQNPGN